MIHCAASSTAIFSPTGAIVATQVDSSVDEVVQRALTGDKAAFSMLVRRYQRPVYGLCMRLVRSEADASEIAQETFLRAYHGIGRYDSHRPFDVWLFTIARNLCLDTLRRKSRNRMDNVDDHAAFLPSGEGNAEDSAIVRQERAALENAIATLSLEDREVLSLYYSQRKTTKEIAQIVKVAQGTVMARLFRAREKLRTIMKAAEENPVEELKLLEAGAGSETL